MHFEFCTTQKIIFGSGVLKDALQSAATFGQRVLVVHGKRGSPAQVVVDTLAALGAQTEAYTIPGEPTIPMIEEGVRFAKSKTCDCVVAIGGGSVLDGAKAIAALLSNPGTLMDYLEVIGGGAALKNPAAPVVAIPTTAGAGAEVTKNAVLLSPKDRVKVSMRHPSMLPRVSVVDPVLTHSMPPEVTASTGLDALTQLLEAFVTPFANPMTDSFCREGLGRAARALPRAYANGNDTDAREDMALAALFGGLALANAKLGAVHGFAAPLGGMFPAPHGAVCARLLAPVMDANLRALRAESTLAPALKRYEQAAQWITGDLEATAEDGATWLRQCCSTLKIPALSSYGLEPADFSMVAEKAGQSSSMKGNPVQLTQDELVGILHGACDL